MPMIQIPMAMTTAIKGVIEIVKVPMGNLLMLAEIVKHSQEMDATVEAVRKVIEE